MQVSKMKINCENLTARKINEAIMQSSERIVCENCCGQRYIGAASSGKTIEIEGISGNDCGGLLDGSTLILKGNAQEGLGDTMNAGKIIVHGHCGDICAYGMRGGKIFIRDYIGVRGGIHMKEYGDSKPLLMIGETAGACLGEYLAGGTIIVLNRRDEPDPVENVGVGQHGGVIYVRIATSDERNYEDVVEGSEIEAEISEFCEIFKMDKQKLLHSKYRRLLPETKNPYQGYYCMN